MKNWTSVVLNPLNPRNLWLISFPFGQCTYQVFGLLVTRLLHKIKDTLPLPQE